MQNEEISARGWAALFCIRSLFARKQLDASTARAEIHSHRNQGMRSGGVCAAHYYSDSQADVWADRRSWRHVMIACCRDANHRLAVHNVNFGWLMKIFYIHESWMRLPSPDRLYSHFFPFFICFSAFRLVNFNIILVDMLWLKSLANFNNAKKMNIYWHSAVE